MDKIKSLLLPLALVFAALAVFETGARYGATNMRAHAIAGELAFPLNAFVQGQGKLDAVSLGNIASVIDNGVAAASMHRQIWYLDKNAKASLDKVLAFAFTIRGDGVEKRIVAEQEKEGQDSETKDRLSKVLEAVKSAQAELVEQAAASDTPEPEAPAAE
ncbi:MAG TPA: hypothetical protein DCX06_09515 [Opitutae bacterium]|nr:hypothetical protein [Opitutae bacterium]